MANTEAPCLFALQPSHDFGARVAAGVGIALSPHEERDFEDGEHKTRPLVSVRGRDVFVLHSLYAEPGQSVNDKLCRMLLFIGALRDASAQRITAVIPYLAYARKDRKTKPRDPVSTRYVAALFEAVGADRVLSLDVHNLAAYQNAFRCHSDHLEARPILAARCAGLVGDEEVTVLSPDIGGAKRAQLFREELAARLGRPVAGGFVEKRRSAGVVSGELLVGDVAGRAAILVDDLIATGGTLARAAAACKGHGARRVLAVASHGLFVGQASAALSTPALDQVLVTNSVPPFRLDRGLLGHRLTILDAAPLFAEAIRRIHEGGSLVELLSHPPAPA